MKVTEYGGDTLFLVEGVSLRCSNVDCAYSWSPQRTHRLMFEAGDRCPKCKKRGNGKAGRLESVSHLVDIAAYDGNGKCSCERFEFKMRSVVEKMSKAERAEVKVRCHHLIAARHFKLDLLLAHHNGKGK